MQQATRWNLQYEAQRLELLKRIERWSKWSEFNEEATITGLVLPVLQHLGYDPFDPEQVFPQARDKYGNKPDLVLYKDSPLDGGAAWCVIEVKALAKSLDEFVPQLVQYLTGSKAQWFVLTNGMEWLIYDKKSHDQDDDVRANELNREHVIGGKTYQRNDLQRITISQRMAVSLKSLGALDILHALLGKDESQRNFKRAEEIYVVAQLVDAAKQTDWGNHQVVWKDGDVLVKSVRETLERVRSQFPSCKNLIDEWERDFKDCLRKGVPPDWWDVGATTSVGPASMATSGTAPANTIDLQSLKGKPDLYKRKKPEKLFIGNEEIDLKDKTWAELLVRVVEYLDRRGCLPKPPFKRLYSISDDNFRFPANIKSRQYGKVYVETHSDTSTKISQLLKLLREAKKQCSDIGPEMVRVKLRDD